MTRDSESSPGPGWYPDPSRSEGHRWWTGSSWAASIWRPPGTPNRDRSWTRLWLLTSALIMFVWAGLWLVLLPALALNDADNGRLGHDFRTLWVPEFLPALVTAVACVVCGTGLKRRPGNTKQIALPMALIAATIVCCAIAIAMHGN